MLIYVFYCLFTLQYFVLDYVDVICPNGWERVKDRCYRYYTGESTVTTFTQAQDVCAVDCGSLARANFYDCNYVSLFLSSFKQFIRHVHLIRYFCPMRNTYQFALHH